MMYDQETGSILKIGFALSKRPHLHRAYVVGVFTNISTTVQQQQQIKLK